jgi:hypothetical protein
MNSALWEEIKYISRQLGIIDSKAHNVITIDAVLIVISTLTSLFDEKLMIALQVFHPLPQLEF